ncbi:MAG: hypothetical protein PHC64_10770 [Candidatus Gastranaerophilales bacterium]|nr:hypothetical protein [Candidatus Gastranaerophilales bacterium]
MKNIDCIYETKKRRNAEWVLAILKTGKKAIFMNGRLQRIFSDYDEALTIFEIYTK